jgi:hypothetical protein
MTAFKRKELCISDSKLLQHVSCLVRINLHGTQIYKFYCFISQTCPSVSDGQTFYSLFTTQVYLHSLYNEPRYFALPDQIDVLCAANK